MLSVLFSMFLVTDFKETLLFSFHTGIRHSLLESEDHECPSCHEKSVSPDTLIPNRYLRNSVAKFKNETGFNQLVKKVVAEETEKNEAKDESLENKENAVKVVDESSNDNTNLKTEEDVQSQVEADTTSDQPASKSETTKESVKESEDKLLEPSPESDNKLERYVS